MWVAAKDCLATVYQKHRSLQTLKEEVKGLKSAQCRKIKGICPLHLCNGRRTEVPVNGSSNSNCSTVAKSFVG